MDSADVQDVRGKVRFIANPVREAPGLAGPAPGLVFGVFPLRAGGFEVFIYNRIQERWFIERSETRDFVNYTPREAVLRQPDDERDWLSHRSLIRRPDNGEYALMLWTRGRQAHEARFFRSKDGRQWDDLHKQAAAYGDHDACGLLWDEATRQYIVLQTTYQEWPKRYPDNLRDRYRRVLVIRTSKDLIHWEPSLTVSRPTVYHPAERMIVPDTGDPEELEFYWLRAFRYRDRYVGAMLNYAPSPQAVNPNMNPRPGVKPTPHGPHLGVEWWSSRDGFHWDRPYRDYFAGQVMHCPPAIYGDQLIWLLHGRAWTLPVDRVAGIASRANSEFSTHLFRAPGKPLFLNATASFTAPDKFSLPHQAYVMVEVRDASGKIMPGYEKENCTFQDVDGIRLPLRWKERDLRELAGREVLLRFFFRDAVVYAVTTEDDPPR